MGAHWLLPSSKGPYIYKIFFSLNAEQEEKSPIFARPYLNLQEHNHNLCLFNPEQIPSQSQYCREIQRPLSIKFSLVKSTTTEKGVNWFCYINYFSHAY